MGNFFDGWRRKAGVITLAMACGLTSAWLRSFSENYKAWSHKLDDVTSYWVGLRNDHVRIESLESGKISAVRKWSIGIPYLLAVPLTLSSAYLLLWEPRKRKADQISKLIQADPIPDTDARSVSVASRLPAP